MKKITILVVIIIILSSFIHGVVFGNWFCSALYPDQCESKTTLDSIGASLNIGDLQVQAAAAFLSSSSLYQKFLEKFEMNVPEQSMVLDECIYQINIAEKMFTEVYIQSLKFKLNPQFVLNLKTFNYNYFCYTNELNIVVWAEVEEFLKKGDVFGIMKRIVCKTGQLRNEIEAIRQTMDKGEPDILTIYKVNQHYAELGLFGQYMSMVFRIITQRIQ